MASHSETAKAAALELTRSGMSARDAEKALGKRAIKVPWRTIARWEEERRKGVYSAPKAKPRGTASPTPAAPATSPPETPRGKLSALIAEACGVDADDAGRPPGEALETFEAALAAIAGDASPTAVDVETLVALIRLLTAHLGKAIGVSDWSAIRPLFQFRVMLSTQLAAVQPPEKPDPERDPTNLDALAALRARHAELRHAAEETPQGFAAVKAHVDELARRMATRGAAEGTPAPPAPPEPRP